MDPQQPSSQQIPPQNQSQPVAPDQTAGSVVPPQQPSAQPTYSAATPQPSPAPMYDTSLSQPSQPKSSKTPLLIGGAVILLAVVIAGLIFALGNKKSPTSSTGSNNAATTSSTSTAFTPASKKACDAFTLTTAQGVLGSAAQPSSLNGAADTATADQSISSCGYQLLNGSNVTTANVTLTGALSQKGLTVNTAAFSALKSKDAGTTVTGVGDQAYYDSKTNTLMVLKGSYSLVVTYLAENNGSLSYSQNQAVQIAKAVVGKL